VKSLRCLLILSILGLSSSVALANNIDPQAKLGGGGTLLVLLTGNDPHFTGTFTQTGGILFADFEFINGTGFTAGAMNLLTTDTVPLFFSTDNTGDPFFNTSSPTTPTLLSPGGSLTLSFFGTDATHPGIVSSTCTTPNVSSCTTFLLGSDFVIEFSVGDVPLNGSFTFQGTLVPISTPEPPAILLVLAGGVLFPFFKRS
jgi:hypothetical protein